MTLATEVLRERQTAWSKSIMLTTRWPQCFRSAHIEAVLK
jgi:hypothetical protein